MLVAHLKCTVAKTGGILSEISTTHTKLSQYCHGCGTYHKKALSERWHQCLCGVGPVQRDLYSAFLATYLDPNRTLPSITQSDWAGVETRLMAVMESLAQRASAGHLLPQSFGLTRAGARRPQSLASSHLEPPVGLLIDSMEAVGLEQEPPRL
jgi:hypothetical protein